MKLLFIKNNPTQLYNFKAQNVLTIVFASSRFNPDHIEIKQSFTTPFFTTLNVTKAKHRKMTSSGNIPVPS